MTSMRNAMHTTMTQQVTARVKKKGSKNPESSSQTPNNAANKLIA